MPRYSALLRLLPGLLVVALLACTDEDDGQDLDRAAPEDTVKPDVPMGGVDPTPADSKPREVVVEIQPLLPGELAEAKLTGGPNDRVVLHFEAPVPELDWNIHGHAGGGTQTVVEELNRSTVDYVFTPSAQGEWFLLLRNSGSSAMEVQVRAELFGAITWSWE